MNKLKIYKIGGGIIDNPQELNDFLYEFSNIKDNKILVHGGGKGANKTLNSLGIQPKMINGRRITDLETLNVVVSFYAGITNKNIVATLQKFDCNALGISGADANIIQAKKREIKDVDFGFVGDLNENSINTNIINLMLNNNLVPVFCAITHDKKGNLLNTNADTITSNLAIALSDFFDVEIHFCFDKIGVLKDIKDENSIIYNINKENYNDLLNQNIISEGMIPKLENALQAIENGVKKVFLEHPKNINNKIKTCIE